jgi:Carboxypeptidase regulatory-like domain
MQRVATSALAFGLLTACALGQSTPEPSGSIQGAVFTTEQDHARSVVPGTKLSLDGALHLEAESDSEGTFVFSAVPAGSYTITAQAPGLTATQNIEVRAGSVSQLELEMKVQAVTESTTVTASTDPVEIKESSGSNTIGESAVVHMPNRDEHFESLLPLVPGVVRGPNGLINMKGAQASQNGSLVNSADVTRQPA